MKIAILHLTMGLVDRGSEQVVKILASELAKNHEVHVLQAGKIAKEKYQSHQVFKMTQAPPPAPRNVFDKVKRRLKLDQESIKVREFTYASLTKISKLKPDILIAINGSDQIRILKSNFPHIPVVAFGHAGIGMHDRAAIKANPDLFVCLSTHALKWAQTISSKHTKLVVIPNPYLPLRSYKAATVQLSKPVILTVGAFSVYKNILDVIAAVRRLKASLILIGDGEQNDKIARELSSLPNEFKWLKHVDPQEMVKYYLAADVFCLVPESQEAFGAVYLEAMSAGLPIVASDDPIRHEIIGDQGFYAQVHDLKSISDQIIAAAQKDKLDYSAELRRYHPKVVTKALEQELYALIKN